MEKRVLIATILSLAVLMLWQLFFIKPTSQMSKDFSNQHGQKPGEILTEKENKTTYSKQNNFSSLNYEPVEFAVGNLKIVFNKFGAGIREIYIKEKRNKGESVYNILCRNGSDSLSTFPQLKYEPKLEVSDGEYIISFLAKNSKDTIEKKYKFKDVLSGSWIDVIIEMSSDESLNFLWQHYVYTDQYRKKEPNMVYYSYVSDLSGKSAQLVKKVDKGTFSFPKEITWISLSGKYFIISFFPQEDVPAEIEIVRPDKTDKTIRKIIISPIETKKVYKLKLLVSPLSIPVLKSVGNKLIQTIEWGTFAPVSKLFYEVLVFFNKIFNNYGLAIIGLTIILQIITFPLTFTSLKSASHMRQIQPQIQTLQKIYKDDPKRLNSEIMNLYKEKKVNPFSGCLPILLQIPIFWALFTMLQNTYDLRGAEFILWIKDLSQPDRLYIPGINFGIPVLTLLMGVSMFTQQIFSGSLSDPNQKMVAFIFPIMFTVMFVNFPSGLVLYWFINNLFTIGTQFIINKTLSKQK